MPYRDDYPVYCDNCGEKLCDGGHHLAGEDWCWSCADMMGEEPGDTILSAGEGRCFGVEVETSSCDHFRGLRVKNPCWGFKEDCSVDGLEFYSGILQGAEGLKAIESLCNYAAQNDWSVDRSCGLHVHLDMRHETDDTLVRIAAAFYNTSAIWRRIVDDGRYSNTYCKNLDWSLPELKAARENLRSFSRSHDRFTWFNVAAYDDHRTFEIRNHHGTIDATEIKNWVRALLIFTDWAAKASDAQLSEKFGSGLKVRVKFDNLCDLWAGRGAEDLCDFYTTRVSSSATWTPSRREIAV